MPGTTGTIRVGAGTSGWVGANATAVWGSGGAGCGRGAEDGGWGTRAGPPGRAGIARLLWADAGVGCGTTVGAGGAVDDDVLDDVDDDVLDDVLDDVGTAGATAGGGSCGSRASYESWGS